MNNVKEDQHILRNDFTKMFQTLTDEIKELKEERKRPEENPTSHTNQMPTQDVCKKDKALRHTHDNINKAFDKVKRGIGGNTQGIYALAPAPQQSPPRKDGKPSGVRRATGGHTQGIYARYQHHNNHHHAMTASLHIQVKETHHT